MQYSQQIIVKRWIPILKEYERTKAFKLGFCRVYFPMTGDVEMRKMYNIKDPILKNIWLYCYAFL